MNASDTSGKMPVLFIGHGSPTNIIADNAYTRSLGSLARELPRPEAIMVISAHWLTDGTFVGCMGSPGTIHDFYGFPRDLYEIEYPAPGSPDLAKVVREAVPDGLVRCSDDWGLDHASWSVLLHMYPEADIPVFEMSLDYAFNDRHPKPVEYHYNLGGQLGALRRNGILIIGSGNMVHNLGLVDFNTDAEPFEWAVEADGKMKACLVSGDHAGLVDFEGMGKAAELAVPTLDHYLPMIYAIAMQESGEAVSFTYEGFQNGSVSMRCFRIG